ncbi:MAG: hypothetical protein ACM37W_10045 [Actinomycetota bacterium]
MVISPLTQGLIAVSSQLRPVQIQCRWDAEIASAAIAVSATDKTRIEYYQGICVACRQSAAN